MLEFSLKIISGYWIILEKIIFVERPNNERQKSGQNKEVLTLYLSNFLCPFVCKKILSLSCYLGLNLYNIKQAFPGLFSFQQVKR